MNLKYFLRPGKGASDPTLLFADQLAFEELIKRLASLFDPNDFDKIICIEGKGFLLGGAVANAMKKGVALVRTRGKLKNETYSVNYSDYSKEEKTLEIQKNSIAEGEKVIIVDDWVETGNTIKAAIELIGKCGGKIVGIGAFMDDSSQELKKEFEQYSYRFLEEVTREDKF